MSYTNACQSHRLKHQQGRNMVRGNWLADTFNQIMDRHTPRGVEIPLVERVKPEKEEKAKKTTRKTVKKEVE